MHLVDGDGGADVVCVDAEESMEHTVVVTYFSKVILNKK